MGIVINVVREIRRQSKAPRDAAGFVGKLSPGISVATPEVAALTAENASLLRLTLADLPDRQKEAIVLRFFEDLSVEQTAAAMNCAPGTVKATVHQAIRTLRQKLKQLA
jgi:RNA polymerase sigma factor (sigma-70 family)